MTMPMRQLVDVPLARWKAEEIHLIRNPLSYM